MKPQDRYAPIILEPQKQPNPLIMAILVRDQNSGAHKDRKREAKRNACRGSYRVEE